MAALANGTLSLLFKFLIVQAITMAAKIYPPSQRYVGKRPSGICK